MSPAPTCCSNWASPTRCRWKSVSFVTIPSVSNGTFTGSWQGVTAPPTESSRSRDSTIWCYASTTGEYSSRAHGLMVGSRESCARRPAGRRGGAENCRKNDNMNLPKHNANDLFAEALRLTNPAERAAYLNRTCAGDPALRQEVESLLRSEEHTSELQAPCNLVCRLLLEKKKKKTN